ncbi:PdaC/SigV domain-containing protein [Paenibacillus sp. YN15]|uniref:PdaC/SigV domain-containing protein n=1 Tax=Paenibacillus sp. YN15 TaxID=1742774 RepID=UPI000DCB38E3|nr:DUF4163 domain-containing protein [Paenibacillus sp. YN15]RAU97122.1 hypothetical protein DQG13_19330 [Paenibacillus sp. YN15]
MKPNPNQTAAVSVPRLAPSARRFITLPLAAVLLAGTTLLPVAVPAAQAEASGYAAEAQQQAEQTTLFKSFIMEINGQQESVPGAVSPDGGTTYVAIRTLSEKLGLEVAWDPQNEASTVSGRNVTLVTKVSNPEPYTINGQKLYGAEPLLVDGTTYLPALFFLDTFGYTAVTDEATGVTAITALPVNALTITTGILDETTDKLEFKLQYPQIAGLADKAVQDKINGTIQTEITRLAEAARKDLEQAGDSERTIPNGYTVYYFVKQNSGGKLSLYLQSYLYTGGAHGMPGRVPLTFDLTTGDTLTLQQAAGNNPDYAAIINMIVKEEFATREMVLAPFESISADQPYFLQNNDIVVYFEPYEYTAYAAGFPEFAIPASQFE